LSSHLCSFSSACSIMLITSTFVSRTRPDCSCALLCPPRRLRPALGASSCDWRLVTCRGRGQARRGLAVSQTLQSALAAAALCDSVLWRRLQGCAMAAQTLLLLQQLAGC
jgi:hypothetical protein